MIDVLPEPESSGVVYDIRRDHVRLANIREASLSAGWMGLAINDGIVGSAEWWSAVDSGKVLIEIFVGTILCADGGPMRDTPTVRIQGEYELKSWVAREGFDNSLVGKRVDIRFARVPPKQFIKPGFLIDVLVQVRVLA